MLSKLVKLVIRKGIGGPARSWIFTSGFMALFRFARGKTGRRETLDLSATKPGDKIVIEHLDITHKQQIKQFKGEKKAEKRSVKVDKTRAKQLKKELRRARKG